MKENKGNIVKKCGTDVESFESFLLVFLSMCTRAYENECKSLSFQLLRKYMLAIGFQ